MLTRKYTKRIRILLKQIFWRLNRNEKKSTAKKLRRRATTKNIPRSHGDSTANPCPVNELDFGYLRGFGPENRADFTNFTFAAKEDIEGPGISSVAPLIADGIGQRSSIQQDNTPDQVSPLRPQENNADIDHGGQFDGAALNNANISTPDQNSRLQSTEGNEPNGNIPRRGNVTRLYMPPRDRRCPRNDGYVSERTLEEYMNSDTQSEQMNNGTENMEEGPSESTKVANEQAGLATGMPTDDRNIEEIAADIWNEHLGQHDTDTGRHGFNGDQDPQIPSHQRDFRTGT